MWMAVPASTPGLNMSEHPIRLVAVDLDGTLLRSDKTVGERTVTAINTALERGIEVIFCTGRSRAQLQSYLPLFPRMRYVISSGGAAVYDVRSWETVISNQLSPELTERVLAIGETLDCMPFLSVGGRTIYPAPMAPLAPEYGLAAYIYEMENFATGVEDVYRWWRSDPRPTESVALYFRDNSPREVVARALEGEPVFLCHPEEPSVEVSSVYADKGRALTALCALLDIPLEQTLAIGDSDNDLPVLRTAGLAVAMENASEDVRAMADLVTADCNHDGVAAALERFILRS